MKPPVHNQGMAIVEETSDGFMILLPDGSIEIRGTRASAEKCVKAWFKKNVQEGAIVVGTIEWRR